MGIPATRLTWQFVEFFNERAARGADMALVTVLETRGSSYSKAGDPLLIDESGNLLGILSGGCLEGDLAERAARAMREQSPQVVTYDLRLDDEVFGLGVGCEGAIDVLIEPLSADSSHEPLASAIRTLDDARHVDVEIVRGDQKWTSRWLAPARGLVLGAGPDVVPLLEMCTSLGWHVAIADHRPAYAGRIPSSGSVDVVCRPAAEAADHFDMDRFDFAIVMSHNLAADREYLGQLAAARIGFVGLLGPPHRRDRLLGDIGEAASGLSDSLRSPVGKPIGGRGPAAIALEVVAELQAYLSEAVQRSASESRSARVSISIEAGSNSTVTTT